MTGEQKELDKANFKKTFAGQTYVELLDIFMKSPASKDRDKAMDLLSVAFHAHFQLWRTLALKKSPT